MRLRIVRPLPKELEGIPVDHLAFGGAYELKPPLYDLLLLYGFGVPIDDLEGDPDERRRRSKARASRR